MSGAAAHTRRGVVVAAGSVAVLVLAGCTAGEVDDAEGEAPITIGTTERVTSIDPAGSYDSGSFQVMSQVYPFLMSAPYGSSVVEPDIAESAEFTSPTEYTVTLKEGLTFANGNDLTASDVKFTFDRQLAIADADGPSSLLYNLAGVEATDDLTVVFSLLTEDDQIFPFILSSPVGPIVDEEVFAADAVTPDEDIVDGQPFAGQYVIEEFLPEEQITYRANAGYAGLLGPAATETVEVTYYDDASELRLHVEEGDIDVAHRTLAPADIAELRESDAVQVVEGPGGEIRFIVLNLATMPYGAETAEADEEQALAVRGAVADLIDRTALSDEVYLGTFTPLQGYVPTGLPGATESLLERYGDGDGGPDADAAAARLDDAGVETPVALELQYVTDRYGPDSEAEFAAIAEQLEADGLFTVALEGTGWEEFSEQRVADAYPAYQLGWFPDYADADNYLTPFFLPDGYLANHYENDEVTDLIIDQATEPDADDRVALIEEIQELVADDLPSLPVLQGAQTVVAGTDVTGLEETLDASLLFRYGALATQ
ncbi:peptide ABC transporter substrate-binding protein [Agromyces rhizosphaerae]|uniref:Peptide ABC transporter substrate-binding protein n=1 Tax=Agromyces rhizosphaerae TaxID=88374 RepID=A0A9W6CZW9_9MICO|nr:ABC transporter substrate-binding protein [Agromyces rhizosphaerae]GLI29016.1 peptide ABC transporter substrate-binding protein [Agromyces rhizosphaerae]